jgi:hypothetical protein
MCNNETENKELGWIYVVEHDYINHKGCDIPSNKIIKKKKMMGIESFVELCEWGRSLKKYPKLGIIIEFDEERKD